MGRLSVFECIIFLAVVGGTWLAIRAIRHTTVLERWVAKKLSHTIAPSHENGKEEQMVGAIQSPLGIALTCLFVLVLSLLARFEHLNVTVTHNGDTRVFAATLIGLCSGTLMIVAVLIHWADPLGLWRRFKYECALASVNGQLGGAVLEIVGNRAAVAADTRSHDSTVLWRPDYYVPIPWWTVLWVFVVPASFFLACLIIRWFVRRIGYGPDGYSRAARLNYWLTPSVRWLTILGQLPGVGGIFCLFALPLFLVRYDLKALLARRPVVYLRSFRSASAQAAFADIVVPVIARYGVLAGLVSKNQAAHVLNKDVSAFQRGKFVEVDSRVWQQWVTNALASCHAVVIDISQSSENVAWELQLAQHTIAPARVAVLTSSEVTSQELQLIGYSLTAAGKNKARKALANWFQTTLRQPAVSPEPSFQAESA